MHGISYARCSGLAAIESSGCGLCVCVCVCMHMRTCSHMHMCLYLYCNFNLMYKLKDDCFNSTHLSAL